MAKKKGKATARPQAVAADRVEAGIVEDDFELEDNSEAIADAEHIDHEALDAARVDAERSGAPHAGVIAVAPSAKGNPYMSEEEQHMDMSPTVMGPPAYGSPDPTTSAGRLLPLNTHPLREEALPEGHPAAISADYGAMAQDVTLSAQESRFTQPGHPGTSDRERALLGDAAGSYEEYSKDELMQLASDREIEGRSSMTKAELVEALVAYDETAGNDNA